MDDKFITADFIGGAWDGKTHDIPFMPEFRVALLTELSAHYVKGRSDPFQHHDVAVYKYFGHGIYWLSRIEKHE
jgi:hypothetical protein